MTVYGATDPQVIGQPISPFFGAQNGIKYSGAPTIPLPAQVNAPQVTVLESVARGALPRNALVASVNGVNTGLDQKGAPTVDDLLANGAGNQVNIGVAVNGAFGNPSVNGAISQEVFVDGAQTLNAGLSTGPTTFNSETLTSCPVSGATVGSNVTLVAGGFGG